MENSRAKGRFTVSICTADLVFYQSSDIRNPQGGGGDLRPPKKSLNSPFYILEVIFLLLVEKTSKSGVNCSQPPLLLTSHMSPRSFINLGKWQLLEINNPISVMRKFLTTRFHTAVTKIDEVCYSLHSPTPGGQISLHTPPICDLAQFPSCIVQ